MTREGSYEKPSRDLLFRGVQPGMMREQVRFIFDELRQDHPEIAKGVILDDSDAEFLYFLAGTCPELRYRFENNRLVSAGYLTGEFGFWNYYGPDFTKPDCNIVETKPGDFHWFRTIPKYDQHGHFIGREDIDDGPLSEASRRSLLLLMEGKMSDVPSDSPDYCKGMEAE